MSVHHAFPASKDRAVLAALQVLSDTIFILHLADGMRVGTVWTRVLVSKLLPISFIISEVQVMTPPRMRRETIRRLPIPIR